MWSITKCITVINSLEESVMHKAYVCFSVFFFHLPFDFRVQCDLDMIVRFTWSLIMPDVYRKYRETKIRTHRQRQFISMHSLCFTEQVAGSVRYSDMDVKGRETHYNCPYHVRVGFSIAMPATHAWKGLSGRKDAISVSLS